jgi:coatomer subunit beta
MNNNIKDMKEEDKPCYFYIDSEPLNSYREVLSKIAKKDIGEMEEAMKTILGSIVNDDTHPDNLMITIIQNMSIVDDVRVKKLLFLFWEVIEKTQNSGKIREEFILVCNSLRKDLTHPNEYVRGRTLKLLTKLPYVGNFFFIFRNSRKLKNSCI